MRKFVSVILLFAIVIVAFSSTAIQISAAVTPVSSIFPSGIYYIRNQRSGLYMDVHNLETANNTPVEQYYYNGGENQRFQVKHIYYDIYEIVPMHAQNMRLDVWNASPEDNTPLEIYQSNSTAAQRFKILPTGNGDNSFKIMTQGTDFTKCLSVSGGSMGFASIVQSTYENNGNEDNDHWYFEEVTLNEMTFIALRAGETKTFEFTVPDDMYYVIETIQRGAGVDTYLTVSNLSYGNQYDDDSGYGLYSQIGFNNQGGRNLTISVRLFDPELTGECYLQIRKQKAVFYGFEYEDANSLPALTTPYNSFSSLYNSYKYENEDASHFLEVDERGFNRYNSELMFFNGHGAKDPNTDSYGFAIGFTNSIIRIEEITNMRNVRLAVWAACYSSNVNNSSGTSFIDRSVAVGAKSAIGFPDTVAVISCRSFTDDLFEKLAEGYTIGAAAEYAADRLIWPWDNVKDYRIAGSTTTVLTTSAYAKINSVVSSQNNLINNYNNLLTRDYIVYDNGSVSRYYMTVNGVITNQFVDMPKNASSQSYATQNYNVSSTVTALPILCDYDLNNTATEEKHLVYIVENNVAIPVLITYVIVTDESGATYCEAVCKNLNDGTYIDYADINRVKESGNASIY